MSFHPPPKKKSLDCECGSKIKEKVNLSKITNNFHLTLFKERERDFIMGINNKQM